VGDLLESIRRYVVRVFSFHQVESLVEVVLIGLVIWLVFRFLRGTRGAKLLQGFLVVLAVGFVVIRILAQAFRLERVAFLYENLMFYVFLGALIVFQPELRRALVRLGGTRLFRRWFKQTHAVADEICAAVAHMSRARVGALMAIEAEETLGALAESGVKVDAEVTSELIRTIFYPGSALHDMGMIIQGDRIMAAGCQFPLTDDDLLDRQLGSRHRAAVGLSQDSNALIVIVSEETGMVSVAHQGKLTRGVKIDQLRAMINFHLTGQMVVDVDAEGPAADGHQKTVVMK
jgi:diadenylate cyclase